MVAGEDGVPVAYAPGFLASKVGNELLRRYPEAPFSMTFYIDVKDSMVYWSLRSEDHRKDVSTVAVQHGGGGHANAAGFRKRFHYIHAQDVPGTIYQVV